MGINLRGKHGNLGGRNWGNPEIGEAGIGGDLPLRGKPKTEIQARDPKLRDPKIGVESGNSRGPQNWERGRKLG